MIYNYGMETLTAEQYRAQFPAHAGRDRKRRDQAGRPDAAALNSRAILERLRNQTSAITPRPVEPALGPEIHELDRLMREYQE